MSRAALHSQHQSFLGHQHAIGAPNMSQPAGGGGRPSRLMQMREDYQRRLLKEKEEKMVHMYEDNHRKNMQRAERVLHGGVNGAYPNSRLRQPGHHMPGNHPPPGQMGSTPSVRDFFRERRELEAKGGYIPPINQHFHQTKNRTGSGSSQHKSSAGVDRAHPLAPIQARHSGVSSAPSNHGSHKPRGPAKSSTAGSSPVTDENDNYYSKPTSQRGPPAPKKAPSPTRAPPPAAGPPKGSKRSPGQREEKVSDFQKWQMEQNKAREERLKKLNQRAPPSGRDSLDGGGGGYEYEEEDEDGGEEEGEDGQENEIARQQRELMERIAQQQAELDRLRKEREEEEEMERQEAETRRKQEAADRDRRRRQQQEEARRRREEEAEARREEEEQRKAARAKQQERQVYDEDDSYSAPNTYRSDFSKKSQGGGGAGSQQPTPRSQPRPPPSNGRHQPHPPSQPQPQRHQPPQRRNAPPPQPQDFEEDLEPVPGPGSDFYAQVVDDGQGGKVKLTPCKVCGRKFADDRIQKHQSACKTASKPRKVFDPTKMRTEGTDMAKYVKKGSHKKEVSSKKKADWRRQHEEFIQNIRYAKKMTEMEKQGVDLKDLPPPPPSSHNPDLVPCPHCNRTFNVTAAERHIPRCKELKTRPVANKRR